MPPEEISGWDMLLAWVFLGIAAAAGIGLGGLLEFFRRRDSR